MRIPFFQRSAVAKLSAAAPADATARAALARDVDAELRALPAAARVKAAAKLPQACAALGVEGVPLLILCIDDEALRPALAVPALRVWLELDRASCLPWAIARADQWSADALLLLVSYLTYDVDPSEVYEVLAPRYRRDPLLRTALANGTSPVAQRTLNGDARFVDLALETLAADPVNACRLLRLHGSPRAVEELKGMIERAQRIDDTVAIAFGALQDAMPHGHVVDVLAALLTTVAEPDAAHGPLGFTIGMYAYALEHHPLLRDDDRARALVAACARVHPMMPVG